MLKSLALPHGIPELDRITSFEEITRHITRSCGQKSHVWMAPGSQG